MDLLKGLGNPVQGEKSPIRSCNTPGNLSCWKPIFLLHMVILQRGFGEGSVRVR